VVEDSAIGVRAATAAGLQVIATTNGYTEDEDLSSASIIVSCLGDQDGDQGVLSKAPNNLNFNGVLYLSEVIKCFR
jgi:beta-phosphoglucomutase-like phosphatase (HAD superfamily)